MNRAKSNKQLREVVVNNQQCDLFFIRQADILKLNFVEDEGTHDG